MTEDNDKSVADPSDELAAMGAVAKALAPLDGAAQRRVLAWVRARFEPGRTGSVATGGGGTGTGGSEPDDLEVAIPNSLPELHAAADPQTDKEHALIGAYWVQLKVNDGESFTAYEVNKRLHELGYGVGNITDALNPLIDQRPQLVIQTGKSGKSKQARKTYKVTAAGIKEVERMVKEAARQ